MHSLIVVFCYAAGFWHDVPSDHHFMS